MIHTNEVNHEKMLRQFLISTGLITEDNPLRITEFSGGVSGIVWKIESLEKQYVVKKALACLRVEAKWESDPKRALREYWIMNVLGTLMQNGTMPMVFQCDEVQNLFVMECAPDLSVPWKSKLLEGNWQTKIAANAGQLLHSFVESGKCISSNQQDALSDLSIFYQLRIEPFYKYMCSMYPELSEIIEVLIEEALLPIGLVHGDFSPKNILVLPDETLWLLDYETTHWGNPILDVAFCITHLLLKGWSGGDITLAGPSIRAFLASYGHCDPAWIRHSGLFLLVRVDGVSRVSYLPDGAVSSIRQQAKAMIQGRWMETDLYQLIGGELL